MLAHETVRASAQVGKKVNSRETGVLIKTIRGDIVPCLKIKRISCFLRYFRLTRRTRLEHSNLRVLQCVIRLVKMRRYRKVISAVDYIPTVLSETVRHPAPSLSNVDSR